MSYYDKNNFEYEFALRTAYNLKFIEDEVRRQKRIGRIESEYRLYEVSQLVNSFIGLLTIPKEHLFDNLSKDKHFKHGSEAEKILNLFNEDERKYRDTYLVKISSDKAFRKKTPEEKKLNERLLIQRLRNAVSHGHFSVYPDKPGRGNEISELRFRDECTIRGKWNVEKTKFYLSKNEKDSYHQEFEIVLSIEEIRSLLFAMCRLLIEHYPGGENNWPEELPF